MGRRLPWEIGDGRIAFEASSLRKLQSSEPVQLLLEKNTAISSCMREKDGGTQRRKRSAHSHSASSSPTPIKETFMRNKIDDRWRMVEDERLSTARQFTAHLHAVEYQKLKKVVNKQNEGRAHSIVRPVFNSKANLARHQSKRSKLKAHHNSDFKKIRIQGAYQNSQSPWKDTSLHNLMESTKKGPSKLPTAVFTATITGAAAGFPSASQKSVSTEAESMQCWDSKGMSAYEPNDHCSGIVQYSRIKE